MSVSYINHIENKYIISTVTNTAKLQDVLAHVEKIIDDKTLDKPFIEIVDFSTTKDFDFGYYQTETLVEKFKQLTPLNNYKGSVLVAEKDLIKGMTHIFTIVSEGTDVNFVVVNNFKEAINYVENYFS